MSIMDDFCVTPEYPNGTYAYFATVDENWNSKFPYVIHSYYGVVETNNFAQMGPGNSGTQVTITEPTTVQDPDSIVFPVDTTTGLWGVKWFGRAFEYLSQPHFRIYCCPMCRS